MPDITASSAEALINSIRNKIIVPPPSSLRPIAITLTEGFVKAVLEGMKDFIDQGTAVHGTASIPQGEQHYTNRLASLVLKQGFNANAVSDALETIVIEGRTYASVVTVTNDGNTKTYVSNLTPPNAQYTATGTSVFNLTTGKIDLTFRFANN